MLPNYCELIDMTSRSAVFCLATIKALLQTEINSSRFKTFM